MRCLTRLITIVDEAVSLSLLVVIMLFDTVVNKIQERRSTNV